MVKPEMMKQRIESLESHILFTYKGKECGIDPFSACNVDMWYGDSAITLMISTR